MSKQKKHKNRALEPVRASVPAPAFPFWQLLLAAVCIVAAGALAYSNCFAGVFVFDDKADILENPSIRQLWPLWTCAFSPHNITRPLASLTLAANYALGGTNPWGYHAFNLSVHILAALALFGIVRRTLLTARLRERFGAASAPLALAVALLWMLHPLQTQAVTYTIQRFESLMGLFYLLTLYCVIRGFTSKRQTRWQVAAVLFCVAGAASKQVIATAPLVIWLYDAAFLSGSISAAAKRWKLYAALAASWVVVALTLIASPPLPFAGFDMPNKTPWEYSRSQPGVILHYLRLAFWPDALCLDYLWPVATSAWKITLSALAITALLGASVWGFRRNPAWGFCGAWFFLILAPTSSIMPVADLAFEHRMYLSLAAVVALVVCGAYAAVVHLSPKPARGVWAIGALTVVVLAVILGYLTHRRNEDYQNEARMWQDVVAKRPENWRAHSNLAQALSLQGDVEECIQQAQEALRIHPNFPEAHVNLAQGLLNQGRVDEAMQHGEEALRLHPGYVNAHTILAKALIDKGKLDEAERHCEEALHLDAFYVNAHIDLAHALLEHGKLDDAARHCREALKIEPYNDKAHGNLGVILDEQGKLDEAIAEYRAAATINPKHYDARLNLAGALVAQGKLDEAAGQCDWVLQAKPEHVKAHVNLGVIRAMQGRMDEAVKEYETALKLNPNDREAREKLSNAHLEIGRNLEQKGRTEEAVVHFREALRLRPDNAEAAKRLKQYDAKPLPAWERKAP